MSKGDSILKLDPKGFFNGNMPDAKRKKVDNILEIYKKYVIQYTSTKNNLYVRPRMSGYNTSYFICIDSDSIHIIGFNHPGIPITEYLDAPEKNMPKEILIYAVCMKYNIEDPFYIDLPIHILDDSSELVETLIELSAKKYVDNEVERYEHIFQYNQVKPIFGSPMYKVDHSLVFVLMPFSESINKVYKEIIKPVIEGKNLVCKRADDIFSNRAIMQDIWKSLCEASIIIADLTGDNPNVMYELGISHTLGKETILIRQKDKSSKFPFDISHLRIIEYENEAVGGVTLHKRLSETIDTIISIGKIVLE